MPNTGCFLSQTDLTHGVRLEKLTLLQMVKAGGMLKVCITQS